MEKKIIPFDLETAKKIQDGKVEGKIKTRDSKDLDEMVFFRTPLEYNVYAVINGILHSFTERGFERSWDESGKWRGDLVIEVSYNEPQFKPFDKVLVRENDGQVWHCDFYSYTDNVHGMHYCVGHCGEQILPYEENEHLVGTTDNPKEE